MQAERIREIGARLRQMYTFAVDDYIRRDVRIEEDEYYVDLGQFGERAMSVTVEQEKEYDAEDILESFPIGAYEFRDLADELEAVEDDVTPLDGTLERMEQEGQGALVAAIRALVASYKEVGSKLLDLTGLSVGPLPPKPIPWPGALRPEIDYTAPDFPLRYQPPPGFDWSRPEARGDRVPYESALSVNAKNVRAGGDSMLLDKAGRVRWYNGVDDKDNYEDGIRWVLWHLERDGIPPAAGFGGTALPRAIDRYGALIVEPGCESSRQWDGAEDEAFRRVGEIRAEYEQSLLPKNEYGVTYDPLTVELSDQVERCLTEELRVGDFITGTYGRVLSVKGPDEDGKYLIVCDLNGRRIEELRTSYNWQMKKIVGVDRDAQPTALSISEGGNSTAAYDPLTVEVASTSQSIRADELRLGDDLTGSTFGRVVSVKRLANGYAEITMNRNGKINVQNGYPLEQTWNVLPIIGVNREEQPTALSLSDLADGGGGAPDYDPLTIAVKPSSIIVKTSELRLGDDVIGTTFGRVTRVNEDLSFEMNRDGQINTRGPGDTSWEVYPIDVPDRDAVPAAVTLPQPVPAF